MKTAPTLHQKHKVCCACLSVTYTFVTLNHPSGTFIYCDDCYGTVVEVPA